MRHSLVYLCLLRRLRIFQQFFPFPVMIVFANTAVLFLTKHHFELVFAVVLSQLFQPWLIYFR